MNPFNNSPQIWSLSAPLPPFPATKKLPPERKQRTVSSINSRSAAAHETNSGRRATSFSTLSI
jgi:hypothetical protein